MFDNLNNPNPTGHQPVDDIFAETDKVSDVQKNAAPTEITAQRVGLTASSEMPASSLEPDAKGGNNIFKIVVIIMVLVILGLLGFLIYNKFFKAAPIDTSSVPVTRTPVATTTANQANTNNAAATNTNNGVASTTFVENIPSIDTTASDTVSTITATTTTELNSGSTTTAPAVVNPVDSDSDGLTDAEEIAAGTNINIIDTDNDGLSDYEEVKIYKTNPLVADTDGDGYTDGQEVRSGYNPNGEGKFPGELIK